MYYSISSFFLQDKQTPENHHKLLLFLREKTATILLTSGNTGLTSYICDMSSLVSMHSWIETLEIFIS